jgi:hypothetical protein
VLDIGNLSIDDIWDWFMSVIRVGIELFVPVKFRNKTAFGKKNKYPAFISHLQNKKRRLWHRRHSVGGKAAYDKINMKCRAAVEQYHIKRESNLTLLDSKKFFACLSKKLKSHSSIPALRNVSGAVLTDDLDKANEFVVEFQKSFTIDDGKLPNLDINPSQFGIDPPNFHPELVAKHLKNVKASSAAGPDGLPGLFWSSLNYSLCFPLSIIFEKSFATGILPARWKEAIICPIFKKGDSSNVANYRPVALTCIACKVMESLLRVPILNHLSKNAVITEQQHGFLARHSTGTQLLECLDEWSAAIERGDCIDACYIDFSRAFDSVSLPKLLNKLAAYGINGLYQTWLSSFLLNRTVRVRVNNKLSKPISQTSGVPQGSVLGPVCFLLFINDIVDVVNHCSIKLYADDVKIWFCFAPINWKCALQWDLDAISVWASKWQLTLSIPKTFILHFGSNNPLRMYTINGVSIAPLQSVKDLGITVSESLSWHEHVVLTAKKANRVANTILHAFKCHNVDVYMRAFDAYVRPVIEYCNFIWNPTACQDIDMIENVQRAFTRRVFKRCALPRVEYLSLVV